MKKLFQVLLSLILIVSSFSLNVKANTIKYQEYQVNNNNGIMEVIPGKSKEITTYANVSDSGFVTSFDEASEVLALGMKNREASIVVKYAANEEVTNIFTKLLNSAFKHTGDPKLGDSLKFQYAGASGYTSLYGTGDSDYKYGYEVHFSFSYYSTLEQEQLVDAKVDELINELQLEQGSKYSRLNRIYDYLTTNVTYNYDYDINVDTSPWSTYGALILNHCVCQGYSLAMYRLCLEAGIDCRIIAGSAGGAHAWNIVGLNNKDGEEKYYYCDSTWDAGLSTYRYYLKGNNDFIGHVAYSEYTTTEFEQQYPTADQNYFDDNSITNDEFTYMKTGDEIIITDYIKEESDVVVPATLDGYPVVEVLTLSNKTFKTITYSEGIEEIGDLVNCSNLVSVTYPSTINYHETSKFAQQCSTLENYVVNEGGKLKAVDGVLYTSDESELVAYPTNKAGSDYTLLPNTNLIHEYGFANSKKLTSLTLNKVDTIINNKAFYYSSIQTINNFEKVVELGDEALATSKIETLNFGAKIKLGNACIKQTYYLKEISVDSENANTFVYNKFLYQNKDDGVHLIGGVNSYNPDLYIHYTCEYIDDYALYGINADNIYLSENIKYVGDCAFMGGYMKNVHFGKNITHFGVQALSYCWYLKNVTIMADNPYSGAYLFYGTNENATIYTDSSNVIKQAKGYNVLSLSETVYVDELKSLINYAQELDEARYSANQLTLIQAAIDEANEVLVEPTNERVEEVHTELYDLVFNSYGNKAKVNEIINDLSKYQAILNEKYTKTSLAKYEEALNNIVNSKDRELTISEENDLITALTTAKNDLENIEIISKKRTSQIGYVYAGVSDGSYRYLADEVLSVKLQLATNNQSDEASLRIVSSVDSLDFKEVGFDLRVKVDGVYSATLSKSSTTVYQSIKSNIDGNIIVNSPTVFSNVSEYMFSTRIDNIPSTNYDSQIEIKPYWITNDGKKVYGVTRVVTINELLNK